MRVIYEADPIQIYNPQVWGVRSNLGDVNYFINLLLLFITQFKCTCMTRTHETKINYLAVVRLSVNSRTDAFVEITESYVPMICLLDENLERIYLH